MQNKQSFFSSGKRLFVVCMVLFTLSPVWAQSWRTHHSAFEDGDDFHFGYISGSVGYSMLQTSLPSVMPHGNLGGSVGLGYEFRNSGLWVNVGLQMSFHRSKLVMDEYDTYHSEWAYNDTRYDAFRGLDTQGKKAVFHYRVNQVDEMEWNFLDVPILVGYYVRGFHVGAGVKVSYALNPKTHSKGTYNLSATNEDYYPLRFEDMPDRGYTDYPFDNRITNKLNVTASIIGEIGYDLLSSVPTRSRICNVLKLSFYFEYGLNNILRPTDTPTNRVTFPNTGGPVDATTAIINPYVNTFASPNRTVPFFTGVKLTYMIGGSRTARAGMHHGCMCYN